MEQSFGGARRVRSTADGRKTLSIPAKDKPRQSAATKRL